MKIIKLRGVHYLSYKGITLTMNQPFIEATDENIEKLSEYLKLGFVEIKEKDDTDKENEYKQADFSKEEEILASKEDPIADIFRYPSYEELNEMSKKELTAFLDRIKVSYKPTMKKEELIKLILS